MKKAAIDGRTGGDGESVQQAGLSLAKSLAGCPWLVTVGAADGLAPELIVYVTRRHPEQKTKIKGWWKSYPVRVVVTGTPRPA